MIIALEYILNLGKSIFGHTQVVLISLKAMLMQIFLILIFLIYCYRRMTNLRFDGRVVVVTGAGAGECVLPSNSDFYDKQLLI